MRHVTFIPCPICARPVELSGRTAGCSTGHNTGPGELQEHLGREAFTALLSAVRALEDWISGARWQQTQPNSPPRLQAEVDQAAREANMLRDLIEARNASAAGHHPLPRPR